MAVNAAILCLAVCVCDLNKAGLCGSSAQYVVSQPFSSSFCFKAVLCVCVCGKEDCVCGKEEVNMVVL